ncbi:hypothetical protein [Methylobacter tundripaludum]|uniref:hypothetical protein n=1 Tax=Methylobacter tundripaludum TaxID=173365 RepID=UPI0004DF10FE|nr:hypothetical protein [Methylobacter tundripaludum]
MKQTKQQWEEVKNSLSGVYGSVYLRCDGYLITAVIQRDKMKPVITVYVNGRIKGKDMWHGKESDLDKIGDIARKFFCLKSKGPSAKTIAREKKVFGARFCKERRWHERFYYAHPYFSTPGAFIAHIKKHNESIEVLYYETYEEALNALPIDNVTEKPEASENDATGALKSLVGTTLKRGDEEDDE